MPDRLPIASIKRLHIAIRKRYFTVDRPENVPGVYVSADHSRINTTFRNRHCFEGAQHFSYNYEDEVLNLRMPDGTDTVDGTDYQKELHVRTFATEDGRPFVIAHRERSRYEHWSDHVNDIGLSWDGGVERTIECLEAADIPYERAEASAVSFTGTTPTV